MSRLVVLFVLVAAVYAGQPEKYEGHQLYRVGGPVEEFAQIEDTLDFLSQNSASRTSSGLTEAIVRLSPEERDQWLQYFDLKDMPYTKIADNLADILREDEAKNEKARKIARENGQGISYKAYYRHKEINDYLDELGAKYPETVTVINAALSYELRQIKYVRISSTRFEDLRKRVIVIDAMVHAREWVTTPVAIYIIEQLVIHLQDRELLDKLDWIIIPLANPDGYEYTIDSDRMWRKTRSNHSGSHECPGVDGNRNFDFHWGTNNAAANPCAITYEGPFAFSESETRVIRDAVMQNINRAALYISLHSFGSMFLYSWGNNATLPSNGLSLHTAGIRMADAIHDVAHASAERYIVGNAAQVLYFTTGTSRDWTRAVGIPLTYTLELPGFDYGFLVPPEYIKQIVTETWAGLYAGAKYVIYINNLL